MFLKQQIRYRKDLTYVLVFFVLVDFGCTIVSALCTMHCFNLWVQMFYGIYGQCMAMTHCQQ
jgi:hypothetical protein